MTGCSSMSFGVAPVTLCSSSKKPSPSRQALQDNERVVKRWRVPRTLREVVALDTASLRVPEAAAREPPGRKSPGHVLAHLDPAGRHVVRASRPGEPLFLPPGPGDLRQYRGLLQMIDGSVVVGHLRLCTSSFAALRQTCGWRSVFGSRRACRGRTSVTFICGPQNIGPPIRSARYALLRRDPVRPAKPDLPAGGLRAGREVRLAVVAAEQEGEAVQVIS